MEKKNFIILIILMLLLVLSIVLMAVSLLLRERVFGQVSGYIAIASIVITLVGVILIIRSNNRHKDD
jgi:hypothetical protein